MHVQGPDQYFTVPHRFHPESGNSTGMALESTRMAPESPESTEMAPEWYKIGILDDYEG